MAMTLHALADHPTFEHVEGGKQGGDAMTLVIMGHSAGATLLHRQPRLGPVERLDLALLIDREHDRVRRRVDVKPDYIAPIGGKLRVAAELEHAEPVGRQAMKTITAPKAKTSLYELAKGRATAPIRGTADRYRRCAPAAAPRSRGRDVGRG